MPSATDTTEKVAGTDLRYFLVAFDEHARERGDHPAGLISDLLLAELAAGSVTDLFLFSHGWLGDVAAAKGQYQNWLGAMWNCQADRDRIRAVRPGFKPLLIGLHWPSLPWGNETLSVPLNFAGPSDPLVDTYAERLGDQPEVRAALGDLFQAAAGAEDSEILPEEVRRAYERLDAAVALPTAGVGGPPGADREGFDPAAIYEAFRQDEAATPLSFGFSLRDMLLAPLRALSFWKMKDRARIIGESAVHSLLRGMQQEAGPDARIHLAGHSFGCIVASAAICGPPGAAPLARPVDSLVLLQGALSLWSYGESIPVAPGRQGYFRTLLKHGLVRGPVVSTQSRFDTAVGTWYPRAAGVAGQLDFAPQQFPKYGALGTFGIQGPELRVKPQTLLGVDEAYAFRAGEACNVDASHAINQGSGLSGAHSDICKPAVAHLVWSAVMPAT